MNGCTYGEHDGLGQLNIVCCDERNQTDQSWNNVWVTDIYSISNGLKPKQQSLYILQEEREMTQRYCLI